MQNDERQEDRVRERRWIGSSVKMNNYVVKINKNILRKKWLPEGVQQICTVFLIGMLTDETVKSCRVSMWILRCFSDNVCCLASPDTKSP